MSIQWTANNLPVGICYSAWIPNTQLTPITPDECKDVSEKNKSKGLIAAYRVAAEGHDLDYFKQMLADHEAAIQQEIEEEEAAEAAKAEKEAAKEAAKAEKEAAKKATKNKRKSKGAETDVEMEDAEDSKKSKASSKKRKNETDAEAEKVSFPLWKDDCHHHERKTRPLIRCTACEDPQDQH